MKGILGSSRIASENGTGKFVGPPRWGHRSILTMILQTFGKLREDAVIVIEAVIIEVAGILFILITSTEKAIVA